VKKLAIIAIVVLALLSCDLLGNDEPATAIEGTWTGVTESHGIVSSSNGHPPLRTFQGDTYRIRAWYGAQDQYVTLEQGTFTLDGNLLIETAEQVFDPDTGVLQSVGDREAKIFEHHAFYADSSTLVPAIYVGTSNSVIGTWDRLGPEIYYYKLGESTYKGFEQRNASFSVSSSQRVTQYDNYWYDETGAVVDSDSGYVADSVQTITDDYFVIYTDGSSLYYPYTILPTGGGDYYLYFDLASFTRS